eukprot:1151902-Pelagomonas_calceolata.AAC.4
MAGPSHCINWGAESQVGKPALAISLHKLGGTPLPDGEQGPVSHPLLDGVGGRRHHHRHGNKPRQQQQEQQQEDEQGTLHWGPEQQRELEQLQLEQRQWEEDDRRLLQQRSDMSSHSLRASQQQQLQAAIGS